VLRSCETRRPEQQQEQEQKQKQSDIANMEDIGDGHDVAAFWCCAVCSFNNDASSDT